MTCKKKKKKRLDATSFPGSLIFPSPGALDNPGDGKMRDPGNEVGLDARQFYRGGNYYLFIYSPRHTNIESYNE